MAIVSPNRSVGVAVGDNQQQRYAGTLAAKFKGSLTGFQPINANLTSISAISTSASGLILDTGGVYSASNLVVTGDVTGTSSLAALTLTLANVNSDAGTYNGITTNAKGLVTQSVAISGDASVSGSTLTLVSVNLNVGTYQGITVNGKGLVTAATSLYVSAPTHSTSTGIQGQYSWDGTYIYFCIATNTWVRQTPTATSW